MFKNLFFYCVFSLLLSCSAAQHLPSPPAMLSVSTDGRYILSTHYGRYLILWDTQKKSHKVLNQHANIYSPYFIKHSNCFLWQDANDNTVYVQTIEGKILKSFNPDFPVCGHVMTTDLKHYFASQDNWSVFYFANGERKQIKKNFSSASGSARLLNLTLNNNYLLTSGRSYYKWDSFPFSVGNTAREAFPELIYRSNSSLIDGAVLWNVKTAKPYMKFLGNMSKTMSTLSPDEKYVISGDEAGLFFRWDIQNGKRTRLKDPTNPDLTCYDQDCLNDLAEEMRTNKVIPDDYYSHPFANGERNVAVKFIDENGHLIRFINSVNYATLYNVHSPKVQAYMDFGKNPQPHVFSVFHSANVIDTAPKAKILVMGQSGVGTNDKNKTTGLIVYRFDAKTKTLQRLWAPQGPPPHKRIINPDDKWEY